MIHRMTMVKVVIHESLVGSNKGNTLKQKELNMSKSRKTTLSIQEIKALADAQSVYTEAKFKLDALKEQFGVKDLPAGKYFADGIGVVLKTSCVRGTVNYKKLLEEHPEIDVEVYTEYKDVDSVSIKPLSNNDSLLKKLFN